MIRRYFAILITLVLSSYVVADEYLIPEDWEAKPNPKSTELLITLNDFNKKIDQHLKDYPQCNNFKMTKDKLFNDGKNAFQELTINDKLLEVTASITNNKMLTQLQIASHSNPKDDMAMRAMICITYASA